LISNPEILFSTFQVATRSPD